MSKSASTHTRSILLLSAGIVALHTILLVALAVDVPWSGAWWKLAQWDSGWFRSIIDFGYRSGYPPNFARGSTDNVAFFPGFPVLASIIKYCLRFPSTDTAMILASHLSEFLLWAYFFLLCRAWEISLSAALGSAALLLSYFGSFFVAVPYSEGLFFAAFFGMCYFTVRHSEGARHAWWLAALHGIALTSSRLVGIPLAAYAGLFWLLGARRQRPHPYFAISALSLLGALSFFAFCQWKFGHWNLYFESQRAGWGNGMNYLLPLNPLTYLAGYSWKTLSAFDGAAWGHVASALFASFACLCLGLEFRWKEAGRERRWPLYLFGAITFYIALARITLREFSGMYRYSLPGFFFLGLALLELLGRRKAKIPLPGRLALLAVGLAFLFVQYDLAMQFMAGIWME